MNRVVNAHVAELNLFRARLARALTLKADRQFDRAVLEIIENRTTEIFRATRGIVDVGLRRLNLVGEVIADRDRSERESVRDARPSLG